MPRWLHVFTMLILTLGIGSVFQTVAAQPAGIPTTVTYIFNYGNTKEALCLGEKVSYKVSIQARVVVQGDPDVSQYHVTNATLTETVQNSNILKDSSTIVPGLSPSNDEPFSQTYTFVAVGLGRTKIDLVGVVVTQSNNVVETEYTLHDTISVRVVPCRLKVITNARWNQSMGPANVKAYAVVYNGEMVGDANGYYSGTAQVVWIVKASIPGCGQTNTLKLGTVEMKGKIDLDEQLHVDLDYQQLSGSEIINCPGLGTGGGGVFAAASPLKVQVPNFGGVVQLQQTLRNPSFSVDTMTYVYVVPVPVPSKP
ncbi:MAG: hypothetical protein H0X30_07755 [Anaerolineae bacterium]|nr:hypothetical protein [Anaerolineae bacterium]